MAAFNMQLTQPSPDELALFIPLTRADPEQRMIEGYAFVNETVEGEGGIRLSRKAMEEATEEYLRFGSGPLREMHQPKAAGHIPLVQWNPRGAFVRGYVDDDQAWRKCVARADSGARTYNGLSVGVLIKEMRNGVVTRCKWKETSLVDRPKDTGAVITLARADDLPEDIPADAASDSGAAPEGQIEIRGDGEVVEVEREGGVWSSLAANAPGGITSKTPNLPIRENLEGRIRAGAIPAVNHYSCGSEQCCAHITRGGAAECAAAAAKKVAREDDAAPHEPVAQKHYQCGAKGGCHGHGDRGAALECMMRRGDFEALELTDEERVEATTEADLQRVYPNEHAARQRDPGDFRPDSFRRKEVDAGVSLILGKLKNAPEGHEGSMVLQSVRFNRKKHTPAAARAWLKKHDFKESLEEASGETGEEEDDRLDRAESTSQGEGEDYADPGYQPDKKKRYPVTKGGKLSAERVKAAWSYIHHEDNARAYSSSQLAAIRGRIKAAAKKVGVEISEERGDSSDSGFEGLVKANYRHAGDVAERCAGCEYFGGDKHDKLGLCAMFNQAVKADWVCDEWEDDKDASPEAAERADAAEAQPQPHSEGGFEIKHEGDFWVIYATANGKRRLVEKHTSEVQARDRLIQLGNPEKKPANVGKKDVDRGEASLGDPVPDHPPLEIGEHDSQPAGAQGVISEAGYVDPGFLPDGVARFPRMKDGALDGETILASWKELHENDALRDQYTLAQLRTMESQLFIAAKTLMMRLPLYPDDLGGRPLYDVKGHKTAARGDAAEFDPFSPAPLPAPPAPPAPQEPALDLLAIDAEKNPLLRRAMLVAALRSHPMNDELLARLETTQGEIQTAVQAATEQQTAILTRLETLEQANTAHAAEKEAWETEKAGLLQRLDTLEKQPAAPREGGQPVRNTQHLDAQAIQRVMQGLPNLEGVDPTMPTTEDLEAHYRRLLIQTDAEKECLEKNDQRGAEKLRFQRASELMIVKAALAERNSPLVAA